MSTDRRDRPDGPEREGDAKGDDTREDEAKGEAVRAGEESTFEADTERDVRTRRKGRERRDVVVPRELYKIVTVFSTLIAIVAVVGGFILLDTATNRTMAAASEVDLPLAILAVGLIVLGAATYAFASRFRTQGMGSSNNDADGDSGNG